MTLTVARYWNIARHIESNIKKSYKRKSQNMWRVSCVVPVFVDGVGTTSTNKQMPRGKTRHAATHCWQNTTHNLSMRCFIS
eukprot:2181563-Alexandrium_andersonii.AAC.1